MSGNIRRGTAARLAVLLGVAALTLGWLQLTAPTPGAPAPTTTAPADRQPLLTGTTLAPTATATPPAVPAAPSVRHHVRARAHPARHRARARHARRIAALRARSRWRSAGGRDIGWPQCPRDVGFRGRNGLGQPMPDPGVRFVIVGLTNGRSFTPNPCLDRHLGWVRDHHVQAAAYAFATYPTRSQLRRHRHHGPYDGRRFLGALGNAAHATARYNVRLMQQHGFTTPHVWLDVEPSSSRPWSGRRSWNRVVVRGWVRAYREAGYTVGFYSTTRLWRHIVGRLRLGLPEWRTAGPVSPRAALRRCGSASIQGGPAVIAQWWTAHRDFDRLCPGPDRAGTVARYFHQW